MTTLQNRTFNSCEKLKSVTFAPNSQLEKIEDIVFSYCPIECITIPQKVTTIEDSWFISLTKVKKFSISPENTNFSVYNDQIMVGKTDTKSDIFDIFMMSIRNIEKVIVPSYIKRISSSCFADCCSLESIEFSNDSKIESIGSLAFYRCPIRSFVIPSSVVDLGEGILSDCKRLKFVEFQSNSKLCSIRKNAFYNSVFKGIIVPSSVNCIYYQAFADCKKLVSIEFLGDGIFIESFCFERSHSLVVLSFPFANSVSICKSNCNENLVIFTLSNIKIEAYLTPEHYEIEGENDNQNNQGNCSIQ